jgi:RNA polymerase sigma factor (sigma-70 family)
MEALLFFQNGGADLNKWRNTDPEGLVEGLAHDHGADLVRFISRRVRSVVDARDLAQETYVRLLRLERKDLIRDPRPYLYRVAANILYEFELGRKADLAGQTRWSAKIDADSHVEYADDDVERVMLKRRLESVLRGLSPKCRAVVILHRREGMTYEEIGRRIGLSPSMVKKYLAQGLKHCRDRLKDDR